MSLLLCKGINKNCKFLTGLTVCKILIQSLLIVTCISERTKICQTIMRNLPVESSSSEPGQRFVDIIYFVKFIDSWIFVRVDSNTNSDNPHQKVLQGSFVIINLSEILEFAFYFIQINKENSNVSWKICEFLSLHTIRFGFIGWKLHFWTLEIHISCKPLP